MLMQSKTGCDSDLTIKIWEDSSRCHDNPTIRRLQRGIWPGCLKWR